MRFTKREVGLLWLSWCLWAVTGYLMTHYYFKWQSLDKVSHFPDLSGRVAKLERAYNAVKMSRDEWRAKTEGQIPSDNND